MTDSTDINFAVHFASDIIPSLSFMTPSGTEDPVSHTGQSITSGSNVISGSSGWTTGITVGQRVQAAYVVNDGTGDPDFGGTSFINNWKRAFPKQNCFVGAVTATTITVVDGSTPPVAVNASYTYNNASPPSNLGTTPLTVRTWNYSTVDPTIQNNFLCRYGSWVGYAHSAPNVPGTGRIAFQQNNFTSFNIKAVGDNTTTGLGETNSAITPGQTLFFCDRDVKDDQAGFGWGYLSKKRWGNFAGATACSNVAGGNTAYVGSWFIPPPTAGGIQQMDIRNPYNETTLTSTTTPIANNGMTVGLHVTGTYAGNVLTCEAAPTIPNASAGRQITIINLDPTVTVRLYDEASTPTELGSTVLTNLRLGAGHRDLHTGTVISLDFARDENGNTYWYEISYNATSGSSSTANLNVPQIYLSEGSTTGVDPFATVGFLSLTSEIDLGATTSLSNFIRYSPTVTFQDGAAAGTHNAIAIGGSWVSDASVFPSSATIGDVWAMVDSRTFIARGTNVIATTNTGTEVTTLWHERTYFGDQGNTIGLDLTNWIDDIGNKFSLTLKGQAGVRNRFGNQYKDITLTNVTYSGATTTVTAVSAVSGLNQAFAQSNSTTSPTTGRGQTGFPFLLSDVGKTFTHAGFTGTRTITNVQQSNGQGQYAIAVLNANATTSVQNTATIHDPSITYTPSQPTLQVAYWCEPLSNAGGGGDDFNRGIDNAAASYLAGNVYFGGNVNSNPASSALGSVNSTTGAATFGIAGGGTANQLTAIANAQIFTRVIRDAGNAATPAGQSLAGILFMGTKGTTGASADWTSAASIIGENDSNAVWSTGTVPGRMLLRTNATGTSTVRMALDHLGGIHFGNYAVTSNVISSSYVTIDNNGKMWWGPTAYTSGQASAAPATMDTSGNFATTGTINGGALTVTSGTFSGAISGVTTLGLSDFITETKSNAAAQVIGQRSGSQVVAGNNVFALTGTGVDAGAVQRNMVQLLMTGDGNIVSGTNAPGRLSILTSSTSASLVQRAVFDSTGAFGVGSSTTPSSNTFNVTSAGVLAAGATTLSGDLTLSTHNIVTDTSTGTQIATGTTQKIGFFGHATAVQQTQGATLTNNITSGGSANTLANYTSLTTYSTDAATIRNNLYQLGQTLKTVVDALRTYGLLS